MFFYGETWKIIASYPAYVFHWKYFFFIFTEIIKFNANSTDPTETWDSAASDLGLHVCQDPFYGMLGINQLINEPSHEIMALFVLRKLILQTRMRSHPVALDV